MLLEKLLTLSNNSIESFSKVNEAVTSDAETVTINIDNGDGSYSTYTIPSFGYLKNSIERLNGNLNAIANMNGGGSTIRLSDGTYRKLMTMKLPSEANTVTKMNSVNTFNVRSNYFFENMMNPLLYVKVNLTDQISEGTERIVVKRFLLDTNTTLKQTFFDTNYKHNSNIDYNDFLYSLVKNGIGYVLDEEVVPMPPRSKRYSGDFSVIKITNDSVTETVNGETITRTRKLVRLNKLTYTDTLSGYEDTMQLAVGDSLEVNGSSVDTRYVVRQIDTTTNSVVLELAEGMRSIKTGVNYFRISSDKSKTLEVDVTVGFNERCVVFVKPVDENSNIAASAWSPGTGFYTNELTFTDQTGNIVTLQQYYQKYVVDFGSYLLGYANDWYPTSSEGIKPDAPTLSVDNFKVVQINKQVTDSDDIKRIRTLNDEKNNLAAQIAAKNTAIGELKNRLQTTNYASELLKNADKAELQSKVSEYETLVAAYNAKVKNITALSESNSMASIAPKYRVRGFWNMPTEKVSDATGRQAIIRFKTRYRYLNGNGTGNPVERIEGDLGGSFSNYTIVEGVTRSRIKNENGVFVWGGINTNDSEEVNINQLDIPITKGEQVEIQIKSVSEAGYPSNPLESDWSEPITISFPEELSQNSVVGDILTENTADESQLQINQTLITRGILSHVSDSFSANETTFTHTSQSIASGFLSENQTPISLYAKLADMQKTIDQLLDIIGNGTGVMVVTLSDENGNVYELTEDGLTRINAGSYVEDAGKLTVKKGAIITKNFMVNITNTAQTGLRLLSKFWGSRSTMMQESKDYTGSNSTHHANYPNKNTEGGIATTTYDPQDNDYNTYYRYDLVPINQYSPDIVDGVVSNSNTYQSAQCKNQFINVRYYNVGGDIKLYGEDNGETTFWDNENTIVANGGTQQSSFVWDPINGFDGDNLPMTAPTQISPNFMVHKDHPYVENKDAFLAKASQILGLTFDAQAAYHISESGDDYMNYCKYMFRLPKNTSYTTNLVAIGNTSITRKTNASIKNVINIQVPYQYTEDAVEVGQGKIIETTLPNETEFTVGTTHKIGYEVNDQYLIGKDTCASYLFLNPQCHAKIQVDGDGKKSSTVLSGGSVISIPLTFQYRMTDYYGEGSEGTGNILGNPTVSTVSKTSLNNIYMANRIGLDIWNDKNNPTSFDIEVYATYGETSGTINPSSLVQYNASTMTNAVNRANGSMAPSKTAGGSISINPTNSTISKR